MTFYDIMHESWLSISGNKMRSFLTMLGIIIGIANIGKAVELSKTAALTAFRRWYWANTVTVGKFRSGITRHHSGTEPPFAHKPRCPLIESRKRAAEGCFGKKVMQIDIVFL